MKINIVVEEYSYVPNLLTQIGFSFEEDQFKPADQRRTGQVEFQMGFEKPIKVGDVLTLELT